MALYLVIFLWGFWTKGINAIGINLTVFWTLAIIFYTTYTKKQLGISILSKRNLFWTLPFIAMTLSFGIYENPWLKFITMAIMPFYFAFFVNYSLLEERASHVWNSVLISNIIERWVEILNNIGKATQEFGTIFFLKSGPSRKIFVKVLLGLGIFAVASILLFIPLLSTADPAFAALVRDAHFWFANLFRADLFGKFIFWFVSSILFIATFFSWIKKFNFAKETKESSMDSIISGVVLGGILMLYILFIGTQLRYLWVDTLPTDFKSTESLVKNGFWQLFFLSAINVFLYFLYYRRTHKHVQKILVAFTFASFLLLISAAQRMLLYVTLYGFSYEKFFAAYTVVYAIILFIALFAFLYKKKKQDIFKFMVITFMWMFSLATILPVEQIIFRSNLALLEMPGSRIRMYELRMLSADVYDLAIDEIEKNPSRWAMWKEDKAIKLNEKSWYEMTLSGSIARNSNR